MQYEVNKREAMTVIEKQTVGHGLKWQHSETTEPAFLLILIHFALLNV